MIALLAARKKGADARKERIKRRENRNTNIVIQVMIKKKDIKVEEEISMIKLHLLFLNNKFSIKVKELQIRSSTYRDRQLGNRTKLNRLDQEAKIQIK